MGDRKHLSVINQGVKVWNMWMGENPYIVPDLAGADLAGADLAEVSLGRANLAGADLSGAHLAGAYLSRASLTRTRLSGANLSGANLTEVNLEEADLNKADLSMVALGKANLSGADLTRAVLYEANLSGADLHQACLCLANLTEAHLEGADLSDADLRGVTLSRAILREANLYGADLREAVLVQTNLSRANLSGCHIFGISTWNPTLDDAIQANLIITAEHEPVINVDNLEVAQFIYLLLHNIKIREVIDTVGKKAVLILGRFTPERKAILDALREELRKRNYISILFDFEKPGSRDLTETIMTLAGMARFVIADLSDPNSIPHDLMSFAERLLSVPVQAIFCPTPEHRAPYLAYEYSRHYPHVLDRFGNKKTYRLRVGCMVTDTSNQQVRCRVKVISLRTF